MSERSSSRARVRDRFRYTWESWSRIQPASQGQHPDPRDPDMPPPDPARWSAGRRRAWASAEMDTFRRALVAPGSDDVRSGVVSDLSLFFGLPPDECVRRCINWESASVSEWSAEARLSDEARLRFYRSTTSWAFDLLWWSYLQAEGFGDPQTVMAAGAAGRRGAVGRHLDFGSGVGVTSQLFASLGYRTDLADVSMSLLEFARFRLERRSQVAEYLDLAVDTLPVAAYTVITAIDTLAHVPDLGVTARDLHAALVPDGLLFAGIDARPPAPETGWHLIEDEWTARRQLQRAGFEPIERLGPQLICYRRVDPGTIAHRIRQARDATLLTSSAGRAGRALAVSAGRTIRRRTTRR